MARPDEVWLDRQRVVLPADLQIEALADQLYATARAEGRRPWLIAEGPLRLGLAAGLLAELVQAGQGHPQGGCLYLRIDTAPPPGLIRDLWALVADEPTALPLTDWMRHLAERSIEDVGKRLALNGWLVWQQEPRWLLPDRRFLAPPRERGPRMHVPALTLASALGGDVLKMPTHQMIFGCLAAAMELIDASNFLLAHQGRGRDAAVHKLRAHVLTHPSLALYAEIVRAAESAIANSITARM